MSSSLGEKVQRIVETLISKGSAVVTLEDINALLPDEFGPVELEDIFAALAEHGIDITE